ncbi:MAG: T9SS type A sorting domain-containing protein [Bacteroidia bacterium]|nr:T9SS type A sorting domain-containing protein [Bacteroidia bacterium]
MTKSLRFSIKAIAIFLFCFVSFTNKAQTFSISAYSSGLCINSTAEAAVTATASGATSYSWAANSVSCAATQTPSSNGLSTYFTYPCCGIFTITCSGYSVSSLLSSVTTTVSVSCSNASALMVTSSAPNGTVCSAGAVTLSAFGNTTYTWMPGALMGNNVVVAPTSNVCYTAIATNSIGCFNMSASYCMSVIPTYTMAISGSTQICAGTSTTFSLTGGPSFVTNPGNIASANPILTPSVSTMYTISCPSASYACATSSVFPIIVNPVPIVNINPTPSNTLCSGSSKTLVATGTSLSYTWSTGATTNSIVVSPTANACYSVVGGNAQNCQNIAVYCLSVMPLPTLSISGNNTVCLGSSTTLTVSGAASYSWAANSSTFTTLNVLPTNTTPVSNNVYGTGTNGCVDFLSYTVTANAACAIVWPGDANRDGQVDNTDVLELGLAASSTGPARTSTSNAWAGQLASAWTGTISTGWNKCHADCNGDGLVNTNDNVAISANFSLTHTFKGPAAAGNDIQIVANGVANAGMWNKADIVLGSSASPLSQLYGVAFDLNFDQAMIHSDSVKVVYTSSFLNASNININFEKAYFSNGKSYCATVRTNNTNVNGTGKIGELWFKVKTGLPANSKINLSVSSAKGISASGVLSSLGVAAPVSVSVENNPVGFNGSVLLNNSLRFYPNPASKMITLQNDLSSNTTYRIMDISGRVVMSGEFQNTKTVDVSKLAAGTYFVEFSSLNDRVIKKLILEK